MDTLIYCFTGTGNSLQAAKELAGLIGGADIKPILRGENAAPAGYRKIGFVFPVYFWGLPLQVEAFLNSLDLGNSRESYFFAVASCGSVTGNSFATVNRILKGKGSALHYGKKVKMPDNYLPAYEAKPLTEELKTQYSECIKEIAHAVSENKKMPIGKENIFMTMFHNKISSGLLNADKNFVVADCSGCAVCETVCPAKNITMNNRVPEFHHHCEQCMACIQYCPSRAINYKQKTNNRKRYQNPNVSLNERKEFYTKMTN
jgi:ferredoxin